MSRRVAGAALPLLLLLSACVAQDEQPPSLTEAAGADLPTATAATTSTPTPPAVPALLRTPPATGHPDPWVNELMRAAVCWYEPGGSPQSCLPLGPAVLEAIAKMGGSEDIRLILPLIDMLWLDLGWDAAIEDALEALTGERLATPRAWYEWQFGSINPPTTQIYEQWKARLLSITATAQTSPTFEELIDPTAVGAEPSLLVWTGVQPNDVPPLRDPPVVHRLEERYLDPSDVVYGIQIEGEARAYPRRIVAWHGAVNDVLGGTPLLLAHCLPCGGAAAFDRRLEGAALTFGTAGLAFQSRTLLFDEQTLTLWDAFSGGRASGEGSGLPLGADAELEPLPLVTTTWAAWTELHPNSTVLSLDTGHVRDYSAGAAIAEERSSEKPLFPAIEGGELPQREPVAGLNIGDARRAYPVDDIEARRVVHDAIGGAPIVLLSRGPGLGTRAYEATDLVIDRLEVAGEDLIAVDVAGERWFVNERALVSALDGREHARLPFWQGYWFAWLGAFGSTEVWRGGS